MNIEAKELIAELKEADATLNSDNYKSWSQVRLAIASAINYITPKEPEAVHGNEAEKEVCEHPREFLRRTKVGIWCENCKSFERVY